MVRRGCRFRSSSDARSAARDRIPAPRSPSSGSCSTSATAKTSAPTRAAGSRGTGAGSSGPRGTPVASTAGSSRRWCASSTARWAGTRGRSGRTRGRAGAAPTGPGSWRGGSARPSGRPPDRMPVDLVIDIENTPGALAQVAAAISDAGVNIAAATCVGPGELGGLHILVPHAEAARHSLAISHLAVSREREVVVVDVEDRPGVLADLTRKIARAGVDLDLVYVATRNRVVFGAPDLDALRAAVGMAG